MKMYLSDCNPNGTNDLIICDDDFDVVDSIPECTFGYSKPGFDAYITEFGTILGECEDNSTGLYAVSAKTVLSRVACSPCDPHGLNVLNRLYELGVLPQAKFDAIMDSARENGAIL